MRKLVILVALGAIALFGGATSAGASTAGHQPIYMPNVQNISNPALQPPPVCCLGLGLPPAGQPAPVNMAYFGGHVQVTPKIYLVFGAGARPGRSTTRPPACPPTTPTARPHA
jgi:prepilin-type processing-associated H-X9-DG protein